MIKRIILSEFMRSEGNIKSSEKNLFKEFFEASHLRDFPKPIILIMIL